MKIGAQLYSVRTKCDTVKGIEETFKTMKKLGYQSVQVSGFPYDANEVKKIADDIGIHIGLTHTAIPDIIEKTDEVIEKHKILGADMVGIGAPVGYMDENRVIDYKKLIADLSPAVKKINDAGLLFGYHNHHFEFLGPENVLDILFEQTSWNFILDTGWVKRAGKDPVEYIKKYASRLKYVHLKDFVKNSNGSFGAITHLYNGGVPINDIVKALIDVGTEIAYVEQDNAVDFDAFDEMQKSIEGLKNNNWV